MVSATYTISSDDPTTSISNSEFSSSVNIYAKPVQDNATIKYCVLTAGKVNVSVYSLTGELVKVLVNETESVCEKQITMEVSEDMADGLYFF